MGQSGPGSNGNEGVLHIPQISRTESSPSVAVYCHTQDTFPHSLDLAQLDVWLFLKLKEALKGQNCFPDAEGEFVICCWK